MDVRFINPFIVGIKNVFTTMLDTQIFISKPCLKEGDETNADFSAIIGYSGDVSGTVALCFPLRTAIRVVSKFSGTEMTQHNPDFADALGELANMVASQAKSKFQGVRVSVSLPRVVAGRELRLLHCHSTPVLLLPCDSALGRFGTEITMLAKSKGAAASPPPPAATSA
jgi:chemotaxis protein CheX